MVGANENTSDLGLLCILVVVCGGVLLTAGGLDNSRALDTGFAPLDRLDAGRVIVWFIEISDGIKFDDDGGLIFVGFLPAKISGTGVGSFDFGFADFADVSSLTNDVG